MALDHLQVAVGEDPGDLQHRLRRDLVPDRSQQRRVAYGMEGVACYESLRYAPNGPDSRLVAALRVHILNVVMYQGEVMDQLQRHSRRQCPDRIFLQGLAYEEAQGGAQRLALRERGLGRGAVPLHPTEVVTDGEVWPRIIRCLRDRHTTSEFLFDETLVPVEHLRQCWPGVHTDHETPGGTSSLLIPWHQPE